MSHAAELLKGSVTARSARIFFLTLSLTLVVLVAGGHWVSRQPYLKDFSKFHQYLNPTTLYYPTASQAVALAKDAGDQGKIVVIIGGSSVMWGAAHGASELWSDALQKRLGDRYRVINLALPSGSPQEHGSVALQYLLLHGYPAIYLPDLGSLFGPPDGLFYPYVYWDAYYKGYLFPNPEAEPVIERLAASRTISPPLDELKARSALDSVLYFTDFWNFVGYKLVFTVWSNLVHPPEGQFYSPRAQFSDPQRPYPEAQRYTSPSFEQGMAITRGYVSTMCPTGLTGPNSPGGAELYWREWNDTANAAFPPVVRGNIIIVRVKHAPPYRDALTPDERQCYNDAFGQVSTRLRAAGYGAAELGENWTKNDYVDIVHTSARGGVKTANELAPQIQELARTLGYTE